jgi:ankyrin repeat protein
VSLQLRVAAFAAGLLVASAVGAAPLDEIFRAVSIDNVVATRRLLADRLVDPKVQNVHGDTLLIAAIRDDASRTIAFLIDDRSTDLDATDAVGETALMIAAYRNRRDTVERLIDHGAEVNRPGWTALHYAASVDARDIVALLLEHAAYIDAESPNRTTPLMMAARGGYGALCRQLIDAGADPTPLNERDLSASDFAKRAGDLPLSGWLAEQATAWRQKHGTAVTPPSSTKN